QRRPRRTHQERHQRQHEEQQRDAGRQQQSQRDAPADPTRAARHGRSTTTEVDLMTATATDPTCRSISSTASRLINDTSRYGPAWMSTCAMTASLTTLVTIPRSRLR